MPVIFCRLFLWAFFYGIVCSNYSLILQPKQFVLMQHIRKFPLIICLFIFMSAKGQMDYPAFKYGTTILPADSQKLSLNIYNLNYFYNTEWFGNIPLSGTLFGYQLIPELQYQVSPKFILKGGVYLQQEFGRPGFTTVAPTLTAKYQAKHSSYILGTLEGDINHGFVEPIYAYTLLINERLENGFQFKVDTKPYNHDLFINWRRAIHPGDDFKEEFDIGYSANLNVFDKAKWRLKIPIQLLYSHKGGQYDVLNEPLTSLTNSAAGLSFAYKHDGRLLKNIVFDNYYLNYKDVSGTKRQPYNEGNGFLSHLLFDFKDVGIDIRYWNSSGYITPRGLSLFGSVSEKYPGLSEKHRELVIVSFIYDKEIAKNLFFNFRITPYKDLLEKMSSGTGLEYSYEMYLKYVMKINLAKIRNDLQ